ncbi:MULTISPECIES: hypothetical protein [Streptomyces]|uniref:hypothetical protein n=1 Tax=Streptomyces TaxID=1883 RepID=UPI0029B9DA34|nr:hypothetical protein [Streptomyces sp. WI03-4A]MDX2592089.1 hypothetical protein [Streptomyces sp. WI03-4A]
MSATVPTPRISRKRRLALLAATTGLAAGGALIPASAFAATPAHTTHTAPATAFHGPHGHGHGSTTTKTTTTETTTKNRRGTTTTKTTETTTTTKTRRGTTSTKTTSTETTTKGRQKFHQHDQDVAGGGPVNGQ